MKGLSLSEATTDNLVERFAEITREQDKALLVGQITKFNRLYDRMKEVTNELKRRPGDQRNQLIRLFGYPNMQVRLQAAKSTLAVSPVEARNQLEAIVESKWFPQAGDAGMCLALLDDGTFRPN